MGCLLNSWKKLTLLDLNCSCLHYASPLIFFQPLKELTQKLNLPTKHKKQQLKKATEKCIWMDTVYNFVILYLLHFMFLFLYLFHFLLIFWYYCTCSSFNLSMYSCNPTPALLGIYLHQRYIYLPYWLY